MALSFAALMASVVALVSRTAEAANPSAATLTPTSAPVSWTGTATAGGAVGDVAVGLVSSEDMCVEGVSCDTFTLTVAGTPADWAAAQKVVHVHLGWTLQTQDFDLYVHKGDLSGPVVANSGNGVTNQTFLKEDADFDPSNPTVGTGTFAVHVVYWTATAADQYTGTASVVNAPPPPTPAPVGSATEPDGTPRFYNYQAPPGVADFAGEPSIGVNWKTEQTFGGVPNGGTVDYFGGFMPYMLRATFDDSAFPAKVTWEKAPLVLNNAPRLFGDPGLFTDRETGRTFVAQEYGLTPLGSTMEWADDDGRSGLFKPSEGSGAPSGIDHETIGGGPYHAPVPTGANPLYPHGVWYCSQNIADAVCSISLDGGMTFGPAVPMYTLTDCGGIHGHIKIGPDGTAYVPNVACGANQAVVVSEDNGATWSVRKLPTSQAADRDPSVAVGSDNTLYFAYQNSDGHSHVAVSRDKGLTWESDTDVGAMLGIRNSLFHAAVAGDGDRAAVAFFGTTTGGSDYNTPTFAGVWYLYVATTYDRGKTWWTQNVTPGDPIQRGGICNDGTCRNLLDFFGADLDKEGRVLVGYDDGCISRACITGQGSYGLPAGNDFTAKAVIARQTGGKRLFAKYDPPAGPVPEPPARPLPPGAGMSCDGRVATDSTGDAGNPEAGGTGSPDAFDITALNFGLTDDKQSLVTTITLKNFSLTPPPATLGGYYRVIWTSATRNPDGTVTTKTYATQATTDPSGVTYEYGLYDPSQSDFLGTPTPTTGSFVEGPNGTLKVNVPLGFLGNPTIPVTDVSALPAVIEPYALVFAHEEVVSFVSPVERAPDYGFAGANWAVCPPPPAPTTTTIEDDAPSITYSDGWHLITDADASAGHFRYHTGKSPNHSAALDFSVPSGKTGAISYYFARSPKGGTADIYLDGVLKGSVSYQGANGTTQRPEFSPTYKVSFGGLAAGAHRLEIRNMADVVYLDRFVLTAAATTSTAAAGPGPTSNQPSSVGAGLTSALGYQPPLNASAFAVTAESSVAVPFQLALVSPAGLTLQTVSAANGIATVTQPVSASGAYTIKVVNLSAGPVQMTTTVTPTVQR